MEGFKRSLPVLFGLGLFLATELRPVSHAQGPPERPRAFYSTETTHTGAEALSACARGVANCNAWTSDAGMDSGTVVLLQSDWALSGTEAAPVSGIGPWEAAPGGCFADRHVWCVQG